MEHPILFISIILEKLGLPVPHGFVGNGLVEQLCAPYMTYTWLVMVFLFVVSKMTLGNLEMVPGGGQNFWEILIGGLDQFFTENMGREMADALFPMLTTFALYIAVGNLIGLIPGFMSPTSNLNTTLALTIIVWVTHHVIGFRAHGFNYYKHRVNFQCGPAAYSLHPSFRKHHGQGDTSGHSVHAGGCLFCATAHYDSGCSGFSGPGDGICPAGSSLLRSGSGTCTLIK